jgi:hypothetical protein
MTITYTGQVTWANNAPAADVEVRVFRELKDGSLGMELTLQANFSDSEGNFTIEMRDSKLLDGLFLANFDLLSFEFSDINPLGFDIGGDPRPAILFNYTINGQSIKTQLPFRKIHRRYQLPYQAPVDFFPSRDGFDFTNSFKPFNPMISLPSWLGIKPIPGSYGLCGGMSAAAYDFRLAKLSHAKPPDIRQYHDVPKTATSLHRYLIRRSLDTFGLGGAYANRVGDWTLLPDHGLGGVQNLSYVEFPEIVHGLQFGQCLVLALIYERADDFRDVIKKIWRNHQVLAYGYNQTGLNTFEIHIYDCNYKNRNDIILDVEQVPVGESVEGTIYGLKTCEVIPGKPDKTVRGFFRMNYQACLPPGC